MHEHKIFLSKGASHTASLPQQLRIQAGLGVIIWLIILAVSFSGAAWQNDVQLLVCFAVLVIAPLGLALAATPLRNGQHWRSYRVAVAVQPVCALLAVISFLLPDGFLAAILAGGWLCFTILCAFFGLRRWLSRGASPLEERCIDAGLVLIAVGGVWLVISRAGLNPGNFDQRIVLLTAVHFHYAGFGAPLITGMIGRWLRPSFSAATRRAFKLAASGVIAGPVLVAAGIAFSDLLELAGVFILTVSVMTVAALVLAKVAPKVAKSPAYYLLTISALVVFAPMIFACLYILKEIFKTPGFSIPEMVLYHGLLNAFGFVFAGLLAWNILQPSSHSTSPGGPFSRFREKWSGKIGPAFFERRNAIQPYPGDGKQPEGLVDSLDDYGRPDFQTEKIDPRVRDFYEHTAHYKLLVTPRWQPGFRWGARLFHAWSTRVEQINLPLNSETGDEQIDSRILPLNSQPDGRERVRAWIRTYVQTGKAIYVAAYSSHSYKNETYMNIAFPMPGGNMSSILHLEHLEEPEMPGGGVLLTTLARQEQAGDQGVYFVLKSGPLRLPLNETIRVWPLDRAKAESYRTARGINLTLAARHDMWICGLLFLSLTYLIYPADGQAL
ncbi:MAG TPA: YndJ family protein [Chloroflexia bacterium]|nr:YndJ family protein [Chloroflexia bacterium]